MPGGRPTDYDEAYVEQAEKLCQLGATVADLADFFDVSTRTIERWAVRHEKFCRAIKAGRELADDRVERSLYQRAVGYEYKEQQALKIKIGQHEEQVEVVDVERHKEADPTSAIFWLKNRKPEQYRDRREVTGADGGPLQTEDVGDTAAKTGRALSFMAALLEKALSEE